jgi:hypothetical protein
MPQENSGQKPKDYRGFDAHLGLHDVPGYFLQRPRSARRLQPLCLDLRGPSPAREVVGITPAPLGLLPPPPSLLALLRRT